MSKILPAEVVDVLRTNTDILVSHMGQDVVLYTVDSQERDSLGRIQSATYNAPVETQVQIHWSPEIRRLRSLGLYEEGAPLPILGFPKFEDDPSIGDYYELPYTFSVGTVVTNLLEVVDRKLRGHDEEARTVLVLAPKRSA